MQSRFLFISAVSFSFLGAVVWVIVAALSSRPATEEEPTPQAKRIKVEVKPEPTDEGETTTQALPPIDTPELPGVTPANFRLTHSRKTP